MNSSSSVVATQQAFNLLPVGAIPPRSAKRPWSVMVAHGTLTAREKVRILSRLPKKRGGRVW